MAEQFTPGPWSVMPPSPSNYERIISDTETFEFDGRTCHQHVAMTVKNFGSDTSSIREGRESANARLIAAAPELLEALQACLALIGSEYADAEASALQGHPIHKDARAQWDAGWAAVAKAIGGDHG